MARFEPVEQRRDARQCPVEAFARLEDLLAQMLHVARAEAAEQIVIGLFTSAAST